MAWMGAGRRLRVRHQTEYAYGSPVTVSFNELRMTPLDRDGQVLIAHDLQLHPRASVQTYHDYWGALVEAFDVHHTHRSLEIVATSTVDTVGGHPAAPGVDWSVVHASDVRDHWCEFIAPTAYVDDAATDEERADLVETLRRLPTPGDAIRGAVEAVRDRLAYETGATSVSTTAHEAWMAGHGVCQDFSHATLSLLRSLGIPARYVSGYLHVPDDAIGETVHGESHAWVEAWDGGWEPFDPTNDRMVGPEHVVVARGRDYADVPPAKGIYAGGPSGGPWTDLTVDVEITQLPR